MDNTLSVTDNRTGTFASIPIQDGAVRALDLRQLRPDSDDPGLMMYDPAFHNTASCRSAITYLDGERGVLRYRGYPIEDLAENCSSLEVAYLLLFGELPTEAELYEWTQQVKRHTMIHENIKKFIASFHYDAHPTGILIATVAALSTFYPEARAVRDAPGRKLQIRRLIGKMPTLAAYAYRHSLGLPYVYPDNELDYTANFMNMLAARRSTDIDVDHIQKGAI